MFSKVTIIKKYTFFEKPFLLRDYILINDSDEYLIHKEIMSTHCISHIYVHILRFKIGKILTILHNGVQPSRYRSMRGEEFGVSGKFG